MARLRRGGRGNFAARGKVRRGWTAIRIGLVVLAATFPAAKSPAITAAADERSAASRCWASSTNTRLSLFADCRLETLVTVMELSPRGGQPSFSARSRRVCFMVVYCRFPGRVCTTPASLPLAAAAELRAALAGGGAPPPPTPQNLTKAGGPRGGGFTGRGA